MRALAILTVNGCGGWRMKKKQIIDVESGIALLLNVLALNLISVAMFTFYK